MPPADTAIPLPVISLRGVTKDYRGLRPLRIASLDVREGALLVLLGFDQAMAEVLVRMIMGASLPDTGEVIVCGQRTADIADGDAWLAGLERFALLSDRTVLVEQLTAEQTIAMPVSFDVDEPTGAVRAAVRALAADAGLEAAALSQPVAALPPLARARVRLARALASNPRLLLGEHPAASLSPDDTRTFAADVSRIARSRALTTLIVTADRRFADALGADVLTLQPATGVLAAPSGWARWFNS
jgi:ABC-type transporter Mla maintaining outer membrane lipid asymmetry ATPase subunit MlaF